MGFLATTDTLPSPRAVEPAPFSPQLAGICTANLHVVTLWNFVRYFTGLRHTLRRPSADGGFATVVFADVCKHGQHPFAGIRFGLLAAFKHICRVPLVSVVRGALTLPCFWSCSSVSLLTNTYACHLCTVPARALAPSFTPRGICMGLRGRAWPPPRRTIHSVALSPSFPWTMLWARYYAR